MTNVLLLGVVGSTAYGLAGPDSDIDRLGVYAAPTISFHGLDPPVGKAGTIARSNPDQTLHEALKFARLCLGCNPTVSELLWLPEALYETRTLLGGQLIEVRGAFLSARRVRDAYLGYASSQFGRLERRGDGSFSADTRKRTAKHARHLLRLLSQGLCLYATGSLVVELEDPQRYMDFGEEVARDPQAARTALVNAEEAFNEVTTVLPDTPNFKVIEDWLRAVRAQYLEQT